MESGSGSTPPLPDKPCPECRGTRTHKMDCTTGRLWAALTFGAPQPDAPVTAEPPEGDEPYCFRCGRPASAFEAYGDFIGAEGAIVGDRAAYVREEEGTYNPDTNRFACDECYIAIGMPAGPDGWRAP